MIMKMPMKIPQLPALFGGRDSLLILFYSILDPLIWVISGDRPRCGESSCELLPQVAYLVEVNYI